MTHEHHPGGPASGHGANLPRGLDVTAVDTPGRGRFGRMFPCLPARDVSSDALEALVAALLARTGDLRDNDTIPAGFTYLGQFIDHDLTFDPSSLGQKSGDRQAIVDFRTPRLDLDCVYGAGPSDQPYLYEWTNESRRGVNLLVDRVSGTPDYVDLPRNTQDRALIGDPRNDENLIVAQLHLLFIHFHNAVVDQVGHDERLTGPALFRRAQQIVRWHYQWIVTHDFLRRVAGDELAGRLVAGAVRGDGGEHRCLRFDGEPFMPVEFSAAAYRFGHSMVRPGYSVNSPDVRHPILPLSGDLGLRGLRRLPSDLVIDWRFFFDLVDDAPVRPQPSTQIDTIIARRLFELPSDIGTDGEPQLPRLNLLRARRLRLPSGPDVARAMGIEPLDAAGLQLTELPDAICDELLDAAPLWYYVLCEAEVHGGEQLGPVGGRIVAEVLVALLEADPRSYMHEPAWSPTLDRAAPDDFTMCDLVRFAYPEYRDASVDPTKRT